LTFPAGFAPSGANFVSATGPSGSLSLFSLVGQTYRFERTGGALFPPGQLRSETSMGVLLSFMAAPLAFAAARLLGVGRFSER